AQEYARPRRGSPLPAAAAFTAPPPLRCAPLPCPLERLCEACCHMNAKERMGMTAPSPTPPEAQPVLNPLTRAAIFLVVAVSEGGEPTARDLLGDLAALQRAVGFRAPDDTLACVAGVGSHAWDRLFAGPRPAELHPFRELAGSRHRAVATPGDLVFHIRAEQMGLCFEFATHVMERLAGAVTVCDEVHGFRYFDDRDL